MSVLVPISFSVFAVFAAFWTIRFFYFNKGGELPGNHPAASDWSPIELDKFNGIKFLMDKENKKFGFYGLGVFVVDKYKNILEVEVEVNKQSVVKVSKSSMATRALLGGAVFGGVGAVLGGISAGKKISEKIEKVDLIVKLNNFDCPIHRISLCKNGVLGDSAHKKALEWCAKIEILQSEEL